MKNYLKTFYKLILLKVIIITAILVFDLLTKAYFSIHTNDITFIPNFITFAYTENTGAAFSWFSDHTIYLAIFSLLFVIAFLIYDVVIKEKSVLANIAIACILGGAVGNMIDRFCFSYVRDFIRLDFVNFAIFNVADMFITIGCTLYFLFLILSIIKEHKNKNVQKEN